MQDAAPFTRWHSFPSCYSLPMHAICRSSEFYHALNVKIQATTLLTFIMLNL